MFFSIVFHFLLVHQKLVDWGGGENEEKNFTLQGDQAAPWRTGLRSSTEERNIDFAWITPAVSAVGDRLAHPSRVGSMEAIFLGFGPSRSCTATWSPFSSFRNIEG